MSIRRAAVAASLLLLGTACNRTDPAPPARQGFPPMPVKLVELRPTPIDEAEEYVATLKSLRSTTVQPQIDGQITQISVRSGERVRQGARMMQIDASRQQAAVSSQEAELAAREANVTFARQQLQRAHELFSAGAMSKQELEQAVTALQTAEAALKALQAQVQQQRVQLRYYTVTAPTAGIVGDIPVRVGMVVTPQTVLTTIDQNDTLEVYVSVPVEQASNLKNGMPIIVLSSNGRETLGMTAVSFISPHVDESTQSVLVRGAVRNPDGTLRSSEFVRARIIWKTIQGLTIPVTAVARINGQYFVFVAEEAEGKLVAHQRAIKVGPIVGDGYAVLEGLKPGERAVVSGGQRLMDGAPIAPMP